VRQVYGDGKALLDQLREVADLLADGRAPPPFSGAHFIVAERAGFAPPSPAALLHPSPPPPPPP
jgi:hypothetical protein